MKGKKQKMEALKGLYKMAVKKMAEKPAKKKDDDDDSEENGHGYSGAEVGKPSVTIKIG